MNTQEQIKDLERQIENLRSRAATELKVELANARNKVIEIQKDIAKLTGSDAPDTANVVKKPRISQGENPSHRILDSLRHTAGNCR